MIPPANRDTIQAPVAAPAALPAPVAEAPTRPTHQRGVSAASMYDQDDLDEVSIVLEPVAKGMDSERTHEHMPRSSTLLTAGVG